jgi:hypothetical protein
MVCQWLLCLLHVIGMCLCLHLTLWVVIKLMPKLVWQCYPNQNAAMLALTASPLLLFFQSFLRRLKNNFSSQAEKKVSKILVTDLAHAQPLPKNLNRWWLSEQHLYGYTPGRSLRC